MSSRLTRLKVEDLFSLNEVIKGLKKTAELTIQVQPLQEMQLAVVTDAHLETMSSTHKEDK